MRCRAAASSLLTDLLSPGTSTAGSPPLVELARTRVSVHYGTGRDDVPVLCVATPDAVRLPASLLTTVLPTGELRVVAWGPAVRDPAVAGDALVAAVAADRADRSPVRRRRSPASTLPATVEPDRLVGRGPGLTPLGDDVLAGALVAAHAVGDPRLASWRAATLAALAAGRLDRGLPGAAAPRPRRLGGARARGLRGRRLRRGRLPAAGPLLRVGHTSGAGLAAGALHVLGSSARPERDAA